MDLLDTNSGLVLNDEKWKIYARSTAEPPHYAGYDSNIVNSLVTEGCVVHGSVINSVISPSVTIGKGAIVEGSTVMPGAVIQDNAEVRYSIIGPNAVIGEGAKIGATQTKPINGEWQITVVGPDAIVQPNTVVEVNSMVEGGKE